MRYFHRTHATPDAVLDLAATFFAARGCTAETGQGDHARFTGPLGHVDLNVEGEGGHYTRVTLATTELGESDLDKRAKRFLSELHRAEEPTHLVRGAY